MFCYRFVHKCFSAQIVHRNIRRPIHWTAKEQQTDSNWTSKIFVNGLLCSSKECRHKLDSGLFGLGLLIMILTKIDGINIYWLIYMLGYHMGYKTILLILTKENQISPSNTQEHAFHRAFHKDQITLIKPIPTFSNDIKVHDVA